MDLLINWFLQLESSLQNILITLLLLLTTISGIALYLARRARKVSEDNLRLRIELQAQETINEDRHTAFAQAQQQLTESFSALSAQALRQNNEEFMRMSRMNLEDVHNRNRHDQDKQEKLIASLITPIKGALDKSEQEIRRLEEQRRESQGELSSYLKTLHQSQQQLSNETRNLVTALRRPEIRGRWGEITLHRLVELAGMVEHCDFEEQVQVNTEEGRLRPDMVIHLPDQRRLVVDVKTPLDAYLSAIEAHNDESRERYLQRHARNVKNRIKELADKHYWSQFEQSPDFVILFIPGEQFLSSALETMPELLDIALSGKVIVTSPMSFIATLRAVAFSWRQLAVVHHAAEIRELGDTIFKRLAVFSEHLANLGKHLNGSADAYNKAVGSLDRHVLVSARRLSELGISSVKDLADLAELDVSLRTPKNTEQPNDP